MEKFGAYRSVPKDVEGPGIKFSIPATFANGKKSNFLNFNGSKF